jgi:hypothetical protein
VTLGSHQKSIGASQDWITPLEIVAPLGEFDLDPCASKQQPWPCAKQSYTSGGLEKPWFGRIFLNPPYHRFEVLNWIQKLANHGRGVALLHCRTETDWFSICWQHADAILFLNSRINFHHPDGRRASANSGAPPCLVSFSTYDTEQLRGAGFAGRLITSWEHLR